MKHSSSAALPLGPRARHDARRRLVLAVDDSEERLRYRTSILRDAGFDVIEARTGTQALALAARERPSLILLDVNLPDIDGFEVCARLKARGSVTSGIPVLHVSAAMREDEHWVQGLRVGAEAYLREPLSAEVLTEVIRTVLARTETAARADRARREAEDAMRESERRYRELVEYAPYGICRMSTDGRVLGANRALAHMLGYASGEDLAAPHPAGQIHLGARLNAEHGVPPRELTWTRKDGEPLRVRVSGRRIADGYELFVEDVTERHHIDAQLRQSRKLEALGLLTGGVAHDFNNALTVILGFADMLTSQIEADTPVGRDLAEIKRAAVHASQITQQLLAFSREQPLRLTIFDLNALVDEASAMLTRLLGETIQVTVFPSPGPCAITADRVQVQQVLLNLSVNARDAMPHGGTLTIETATVTIGRPFALRHPPLRPGRYVVMKVRDTGQGMTEETKHQIFDPFFTTKGVGQGTGLGLSTVYGIVKQIGGHVFVQSRPAEGTQFDFYFPEATGFPNAPAEDPHLEVASRRACVLVVEDDAAVRALTVNTLRRYGYRVMEASDARDLARLTDAQLDAVELLLTDIVMPVQSGRALAQRLTARRPELRVLYMSGYLAEDASPLPEHTVLRKPFTAGELLSAVREVLSTT